MQVSAQQGHGDGTRRDLVLILLASLAIVLVLTLVLADGAGSSGARGLDAREQIGRAHV